MWDDGFVCVSARARAGELRRARMLACVGVHARPRERVSAGKGVHVRACVPRRLFERARAQEQHPGHGPTRSPGCGLVGVGYAACPRLPRLQRVLRLSHRRRHLRRRRLAAASVSAIAPAITASIAAASAVPSAAVVVVVVAAAAAARRAVVAARGLPAGAGLPGPVQSRRI